MNFYTSSLSALKEKKILCTDDSVLVVAGGAHDRRSLIEAGFKNVCISNLDYHGGETDYTPFNWMRLDAERIDLDDRTFDWVIVHAGLHHLGVPAAGVCEMFRVCRKGIICFEARDSFAMRLALRMTLTSEYELEPAYLSGGTSGGYRNGPIPNYVYRWTEREFEKVIKSFCPAFEIDFHYFYGLSVSHQRFEMARNPLRRSIGRALRTMSRVFPYVCPRQGNQFAMIAVKTEVLKPWLALEAGRLKFRDESMHKRYDRDKYGKR